MGITTKVGDAGMTFLCCGERVSKDSLKVDICGTLDELCSFLGLARSIIKDRTVKALLARLQADLFVIGGEVASLTSREALKKAVTKADVRRLDRTISGLEARKTFRASCFYLPGETVASANLDVARAIARRAERKIAGLNRKKALKNCFVLVYLNRLSDLLYLLARRYEGRHRKA